MCATRETLPVLPNSVTARRRWLSRILTVMVVLLLTIFVGACAQFAEVVGVTKTPVKLKAYMPPRPSPIIPHQLLIKMPQTWARENPELPLICLPVEQGFDLKAWIKAVDKNQKEWGSYADYWESRNSVVDVEKTE